MSPSPDAALSNLSYNLYRQRNNGSNGKTKTLENYQTRGRDLSRHELGRRDRYGERVSRIYPREMTHSPSKVKRLSSTSSPSPPTYNATTSPLLSALGATNPASAYTTEWAKSLQYPTSQASPPDGGIAINGTAPYLPLSLGARDASYGPAGSPHSPPTNNMRPLSHPNTYTSFGGRLQSPVQGSPAARDRRASMHSRLGARSPFSSNPPLPHQPQEHFYGLPGLDLGLEPGLNGGITPGEGGYHCGFDSLGMAADEPSKSAENVLLVGYQGGIDLFRVEKSRLDIIGRLEGLRGGVIGARILPWTARLDPCAASRPLIALVIHGPASDDTKSTSGGSESSSVVDDSLSDSPSRAPSSDHGSGIKSVKYQTTVEIYSLKEQRQVAVLYKSALIPIVGPIDSPMFEPPPPAGEFVVNAKGRFVVVASGASGEVFIFAPYVTDVGEHGERFRCIGKVWTTVSFRERGIHSSATSTTGSSHDETVHESYGVPLFSLSGRWLAVAPPASTTLLPLNGVALTSRHHAKPPGLSHHTVPPQPSTNCAVDAPETPGFLDRLAREGTQVAIKGARWATEKGYQAFRNYMNKGAQPNGNPSGVAYGMEQPHYFPPTHGHNNVQAKDEVAVVSIYDLQRFLDAEESKTKYALHPVATIPTPQGCSFLSFSPTGLMLMTVSAKGDFQHVWDLKRMNFRRPRKTAREQPLGPHVRQVARFARMTVTNVVDVAWSAPRNDKLAVITDKGTVHMFPISSSAFQWPPSRRVRHPTSVQKTTEEQTSSTGRTGAISSAMQALNGTAKPLLDAVRVRGTSNGSRFPSLSSLGMTPAAGAKSGKAVAANVGKSINNIRHSGNNKLTLPMGSSGVKPGSVRWLTGRNRGCIALASGGLLQIYRVSIRPGSGTGSSQIATRISKSKPVEFGLAPIRDTRFAPAAAAHLFDQRRDGQDSVSDIHGEWLPRKLPARHGPNGKGIAVSSPAPLSFSEIESNPPYQPFYTDRRATRYLLREAEAPQDQHLDAEDENMHMDPAKSLCHLEDDGPWLFGETIDAIRVATSTAHGYDSEDDEDDVAALFENKMSLKDGDEDTEQIVVTTKRRRRGLEGDEGGFFEDDCDVLDFAEDRV